MRRGAPRARGTRILGPLAPVPAHLGPREDVINREAIAGAFEGGIGGAFVFGVGSAIAFEGGFGLGLGVRARGSGADSGLGLGLDLELELERPSARWATHGFRARGAHPRPIRVPARCDQS